MKLKQARCPWSMKEMKTVCDLGHTMSQYSRSWPSCSSCQHPSPVGTGLPVSNSSSFSTKWHSARSGPPRIVLVGVEHLSSRYSRSQRETPSPPTIPMEETNAFSALSQFLLPQNVASPSKQPDLVASGKWMEVLMQYQQQLANAQNQQMPPNLAQFSDHIQNFQQIQQSLPQLSTHPQISQLTEVPQIPVVVRTSPSHDSQGDHMLKASPSASSDMSTDSGEVSEQYVGIKPLQSIDSQVNIAANNTDQKPAAGAHETWMECFTTTKVAEYEALLFSVYVTERPSQKFDGWTHFDCLHRLQSKCRYRVRSKKQDEFFIIEEKGVHNHGAVEPVGQAGSHAGLPKTIREIVDRAYNDGWPIELRALKVDEEIKRLGLPANPRLGRQIDNRIAYLRRVKNLSESRRMQDHVNYNGNQIAQGSPHRSSPSIDPATINPQMLHVLMEQNGGSLTVEKDVVEKLLGCEGLAGLTASQGSQKQMTMEQMLPVQKNLQMKTPAQMLEVRHEDVPMNQGFLEFIQQQKMNADNEALLAQLSQASAALAQENVSQE